MDANYDYWNSALRGDNPPANEGNPQPGFYRARDSKGGFRPVAIWTGEDGKIIAKIGDSLADHPEDIWTYCCDKPVTHETYQAVMAGRQWPDDPPARPSLGHNLSADPLDQIKAELASELEIADEFLAKPITTQQDADKVGVWSRRVGEIAKRADGMRDTEKRPHLEAGRAVDAKWRDVIANAKELAGKLKAHVEPFLREQKRLEQERARKAAAEADRLRRAAQAEQDATKAQAIRDEAAQAEKQATAKNAQAGRTGAKIALRAVTTAIIEDIDKLFGALKADGDLLDLLQRKATAAARAGSPLPGTRAHTEEKAV